MCVVTLECSAEDKPRGARLQLPAVGGAFITGTCTSTACQPIIGQTTVGMIAGSNGTSFIQLTSIRNGQRL